MVGSEWNIVLSKCIRVVGLKLSRWEWKIGRRGVI